MLSKRKYFLLFVFYNLGEDFSMLYFKLPKVSFLSKVLQVNSQVFRWNKTFNLNSYFL